MIRALTDAGCSLRVYNPALRFSLFQISYSAIIPVKCLLHTSFSQIQRLQRCGTLFLPYIAYLKSCLLFIQIVGCPFRFVIAALARTVPISDIAVNFEVVAK